MTVSYLVKNYVIELHVNTQTEAKNLLKLINIKKDYDTGSLKVHALKGVDLEFRKSEFVSILGPSGCGKTTMLNIIGGLDQYTEGDLIIDGKSTKTFKSSDWDSYRNHSIGFVFQSYNLIPHQTVLANVELALTLSGVSKHERRKRAAEALEKVGLGDQLHKRPAQLSGGQMQRVAIARALVNDPEILLADEPTGALDTGTSVQIMDILKEISKEKLVIMVTHNPELAEEYSSRIIKVLDGLVIDDSDPYTPTEKESSPTPVTTKKKECRCKDNKNSNKKTSMSFLTALSLSFNNLRTKKGRTIMTSFAGSIGIIGIALILALSTGINAFILQVQEDTLSTYPLSIQRETQDLSAMLSAMTSVSNTENYKDSNMIHVDNSMGNMLSAMSSTVSNDLDSFKVYLDNNYDKIKDYVSDVQFTYDYNLQLYNLVTVIDENGKETTEARKVGMETIFDNAGEAFSGMSELMALSGSSANINVFQEMIDNQDILDQQYEVVAGHWPEQANEVVLVISGNNQLSRMTLYMLGILDPDNIKEEMESVMGFDTNSNEETTTEDESEKYNDGPYEYDYFLDMSFMLLIHSDFYVVDESKGTYTAKDANGVTIKDENGNDKLFPIWSDIRDSSLSDDLTKYIAENGKELKISGIIRPKDGATATSISGAIGYTKDLTAEILNENSKSTVVNQQKETPDTNILTGLTFQRTHYTPETIHLLVEKISPSTMNIFYSYMTEQILKNEAYSDMINVSDLQSFMGVFMLLPDEAQATILTKIIEAAEANPANATGIDTICKLVTQMNGGDIEVSAQNFVKLLPVLSPTSPLLAINGIAGLTDIIGADGMAELDKEFYQSYPDAPKMENVSGMGLAMMLSGEYKTAYLGMIVDTAIQKNKTSVDTLCGIVSSAAGAPVTSETLKESLPTMGMAGMYVSFSGIKGLAALAGDEAMSAIFDETHKTLMTLSVNEEMFLMILGTMSAEDETFITLEEKLYSMAPQVDETYASVLKKLDNQEEASPASINFYAKDFDSKEKIELFIKEYNDTFEDEEDKIKYSDLVGALMSSVTTIVNVISYILIAFVAISLVVSSIMIGIITNISVLERTKEIGILRAVGASKKDISRVFNAETVIIGFCAGMIGVISTALLCIPASLIIQYLTGFDNLTAYVPLPAAIILVTISVLLTMIAGLIPARSAANKDPVIALRSE